MKAPFSSIQEMYNYAANQLIVQNLSQETVKRNLMERGVTDADAEIVIQNMMVQIEKNNAAQGSVSTAGTDVPKPQTYGTFATMQEMYNYAANQLIVEKKDQPTTRRNLLKHGITEAQADEVIKNMMEQINKNKPKEVSAKKDEGRRMMLGGLVIGGIGLLLYGTKFNIAGESYAISYGIMVVGGLLFFRGLFKMF